MLMNLAISIEVILRFSLDLIVALTGNSFWIISANLVGTSVHEMKVLSSCQILAPEK